MLTISDTKTGTIAVSYEGTTWMKISYILTLAGISIIIWLKLYNMINKRK